MRYCTTRCTGISSSLASPIRNLSTRREPGFGVPSHRASSVKRPSRPLPLLFPPVVPPDATRHEPPLQHLMCPPHWPVLTRLNTRLTPAFSLSALEPTRALPRHGKSSKQWTVAWNCFYRWCHSTRQHGLHLWMPSTPTSLLLFGKRTVWKCTVHPIRSNPSWQWAMHRRTCSP